METVLIVIHLMVVLALVGVVLLQRSEGGGLGIGGGSGFMTARGASNALTRATAILAIAFFATSLTLSILARYSERDIDILNRIPANNSAPGAPSGTGGVLDQLGGSDAPALPAAATPPAPAAPPSGDGAATPAPTTPPPASPPAAAPAPAAPQVPNQ